MEMNLQMFAENTQPTAGLSAEIMGGTVGRWLGIPL